MLGAVSLVSLNLDRLGVPLSLSSLPLKGSLQWHTILTGTTLANAPLVSVTWAQVVSLDPRPAAVTALTVTDVDWSGSVLRDLPLAAFALGGATLDSVPTRASSPGSGAASQWCALLNSGSRGSCASPDSLSGQTLLSASIGGADLKDLPLRSVPLRSVDLSQSPLRSVPLRSVVLDSAPLRSVPLRSVDMEASPLRSVPLRSVAVAGSPLRSVPLRSVDWAAAPLRSVPLRSSTSPSRPCARCRSARSTGRPHPCAWCPWFRSAAWPICSVAPGRAPATWT